MVLQAMGGRQRGERGQRAGKKKRLTFWKCRIKRATIYYTFGILTVRSGKREGSCKDTKKRLKSWRDDGEANEKRGCDYKARGLRG